MMRLIARLIVIGLLAVLFLGGSFAWSAFIASPDDNAAEREFVVEPGASAGAIAASLEGHGFVRSARSFRIFVRLVGVGADFRPGTFLLREGLSYEAIVAALTGEQNGDIRVTIPEGYTAAQIGGAVREVVPGVTEEGWALATGPESLLILGRPIFLDLPDGQGLEGYLFPDTYHFDPNDTAEDVARTMLNTLDRRLAEADIDLEAAAAARGLTSHELVTLASIIEREVRSPEEMRSVAGIFYNRLSIGMALQADSTVNYVTGGKDPSLSLEDTKLESPYNTYQHPGLPPGPISNPGLNALRAAIDPAEHDLLYFLTTPEGEVKYAESFDAHVENKRRFLR